jgi:hypothetical protein
MSAAQPVPGPTGIIGPPAVAPSAAQQASVSALMAAAGAPVVPANTALNTTVTSSTAVAPGLPGVVVQAPPKPQPGGPNVVGVHYKVGKKIGEGSFGIIYEGGSTSQAIFACLGRVLTLLLITRLV